MLFAAILSLFAAVIISLVSAYYSVIGLTAIFPASFLAILIMGGALEFGKISTAVWLHTFWNGAPRLLKTYLTMAVAVLMAISSMGVFGFLSKAHIDQTAGLGTNTVIISSIDDQIERQQTIIDDTNKIIYQLDEAVNVLIQYERIRGDDGAIATRERQQPERDRLSTTLDNATSKITDLSVQKTELEIENSKVEAEIGPIRYVAELIYGNNPDQTSLDNAIRYLIIALVLVFDPLAICLLMASIHGISISRKKAGAKPNLTPTTKTPAHPLGNPVVKIQGENFQTSGSYTQHVDLDLFTEEQKVNVSVQNGWLEGR